MNNAQLTARYSAIQTELANASNAKVGTTWWTDRINELQSIKARLGW